ncbi:hypothetical protein G7Y89_g7684 [Cudoniella acicularis]|uniref:Uncharacterized protein n=1 Tax=Cudoniella acicularis TaxID=354080 RepID=A0A8H4RK05_9HELO|nr:hypothetical protein G7Y89_g7684 [Cudoniella acicularis]
MLPFLGFRDIPQEIFKLPRRLAVISAGAAIDPPKWMHLLLTETGEWDWNKIEDLFLNFRDLSLLQLSPLGSGMFRLSMHPLVSEWVKYRADPQSKRERLLQAIAIVNMCFRSQLLTIERPSPSDETKQQILRHYLSCIENLRVLQKKHDTFLSDLHPFPGPADPESSDELTGSIKDATQRSCDVASLIQVELSGVAMKFHSQFNYEIIQEIKASLGSMLGTHG